MARREIADILETERERRYAWQGSNGLWFFNSVVVPEIKDAVATLEKSNPSNRKLFLIVDSYTMPLELQEEALDILISRLAKRELMLIVKSRTTPFELQKRLIESLLDSLIEQTGK